MIELLADPGYAALFLALSWLAVMVAGDVTERLLRRHHGTQLPRDPLTGLRGRAALSADTRKLTRGRNRKFLVLVIDLDRFKDVNDSLGHDVGDLLLIEAARRLEHAVPTGKVYRLGGDEFLITAPSVSPDADADLVASVRDAVNTLTLIDDLPVPLIASVGVATSRHDGATFAQLFAAADTDMYNTKHATSDTRGTKRSAQRTDVSTLRDDVAASLAEGRFTVHYQPQVDPHTETVVGFEAFMRWRHPRFGLLTAHEFANALQQSGHVSSVHLWALTRAIDDIPRLRELAPNATVSVNVSARALLGTSFLASVRDALSKARVPSRALVVEVDPSVARLDPGGLDILYRLQDLGVDVAIPGMGGPRTSMSASWTHPAVRQIKLHPAVAQSLDAEPSARRLVAALVAAGHGVDAVVVGEGVETRDVFDAFRTLGCDAVQGHWIAPPMPIDEVGPWMRSRPATTAGHPGAVAETTDR